MMTKRVRQQWFGVAVAVGMVSGIASTVVAYPRYNDGCQFCHGAFGDATSPKGTVFPANSKHEMHRAGGAMNTDCALCHTTGDGFNPWTGSSDGTANNPGLGCTGCHGRDYGGAIGVSGVGLRQHHATAGVGTCAMCHPVDPPALGEDVMPVYYGTVDTNADDPCNGSGLENWSIGDGFGMDNDGDDLYDAADPDCAAPPCTATAARSCQMHTPGGRLCIDLDVPPGSGGSSVEPRLGQPNDIEIDLDAAPASVSVASVTCSDNNGVQTDHTADVAGVSLNGNTVNVTFAPALPDEQTCVITLDCGASVCVQGLRGDVNRSGRVTTGDASLLRFWYDQCPPTSVGAEFDVDMINCVTPDDFLELPFFFNNVAPPCGGPLRGVHTQGGALPGRLSF
ncbi:MAG: hypothetical protein ACE5GE_08690 [Phycisphaerae bacterium]